LKRLLWIVPLVALLALIGWRVVQKKDAAGGGGPTAGGPGGGGSGGSGGGGRGAGGGGRGGPSAVEAAVAGPREMVRSVEAVGTAASPQTVRLSPPSAGRIVYLQAREGDRVKAGEVLVRIDPSQLQGQILQYRSAVAEAQSRLAQAQATLGSSDVGIASAIRSQRAAVTSAQASLNQARKTQKAQIAAAQAVVTQQAASARASEASYGSAVAQEEAARGTLAANQVKLKRLTELFQGGYIAAQDVDDAKALVATSLGQVRVAQQAEAQAKAQVAQANAQKAAAQAQVVVAQRETQGAILTAEAQVRTAQAALATANANVAQGPANRRNIEALQAAVSAAQGQLDASQAQFANLDLRSPVDGTVTERAADPGSLAQPGTPVMTVQVLKRIFVESSFPVELASQIKPGAEADVTFDALPNRQFVGRISDLNRAADPTSRQFTVRILLDNEDIAIRPGMFGHVGIITERRTPAVVVPLDALNEARDATTVSVLDRSGTVENRPVKVGQRDQQGAEILDGLKVGDRVVTVHLRPLRDGQKVQVTDPNAQPKAGGRGQRGGRGQ